ncbi:MAG: group II intron reverse transcriptase/maturase, partial [Firmicutes bacterium]|nr:group II intron reverse transcriptase/maturase [Bacillota bacterium]
KTQIWLGGLNRKSKLVALGIPPEWASLISGLRKGYWRLSKTPQLNKALGLAFWREQGLRSLIERYNELRFTT